MSENGNKTQFLIHAAAILVMISLVNFDDPHNNADTLLLCNITMVSPLDNLSQMSRVTFCYMLQIVTRP